MFVLSEKGESDRYRILEDGKMGARLMKNFDLDTNTAINVYENLKVKLYDQRGSATSR